MIRFVSGRRRWPLFVAVMLSLSLSLIRSHTGRPVWAQDKRTPGADEFRKHLPRVPGLSAEQSRQAIVLKEGFRAELVAAEPLLRDPVAVDFDELGRMYVVQLPPYNDYILEDSNARGSVVRLEDADGDGRYDSSSMFADALQYPTAVACWDGGVFVGDAPDLLYLKDTDGDGQADSKQVVFTGFGSDKAGEAHLNSIRWGLDNRFHLSTSLSGGELRPADESIATRSARGRGLIFDPRDWSTFELTSGGGQHGLSMDDWGTKFVCSNSVPAQTLMYDDRYLARNPRMQAPQAAVDIAPDGKHTKLYRISPPEPWRVLRTRLRKEGKFRGSDEGGTPFGFFTGATGITIYRGDAWPEAYRGNLFVGDVANNLVYRAKLKRDGLQLTALRADAEKEFLASTDIWFRPVQFANAPDGTLYVLDMCRELIEGAAFLPPEFFEHLDAASGNDRGRIYRIAHTSSKNRAGRLPDFLGAHVGELVQLLEHPNGWHRDTAAKQLVLRQDGDAVRPLLVLAKDSTSPIGRATALHVLADLGGLTEDVVLRALEDQHSEVRAQAVRLSERLVGESATVRKRLTELVADPDLQVRTQVAYSLGQMPSPAAIEALADLARKDGTNAWMRMAIQSSLAAGADSAFAALVKDAAFRQSKHGQALLIALAQQIGAENRLGEVGVVMRALSQLPQQDKRIRDAVVQALLENQSGENRARIMAAAGGQATEILTELVQKSLATATDSKNPVGTRVEGVRSLRLGELAEVQSTLEKLLEPGQPSPLQTAALETLAAFDEPAIGKILLGKWSGLSPRLRVRAGEVLLARPAWVLQLMDAVEAGQVARSEFDMNRIRLLRKHPDAKVVSRVEAVFPDVPMTKRKQIVDQYAEALERDGDPLRGKEVFKKNCSVCHRLEGVGTAVGAELKGIRQRGMQSVLLNILDPNREVKPKFLTYVATTNDGRVLAGLIQEESANTLTFRRSDGTTVSVQRVDIDEMRSTGLSFMPDGLEKTIDVSAMADLLSYLNSVD